MVAEIKVTIDDFRISHLFDIEEPIPEPSLVKILSDRGYRTINQRVFDHPPIHATLLSLAAKNHVTILYQKDAIPSYIGAAGRDKREVLKQFDDLSSILTEVDPTVQQRYTSIEAVLTTKVFGRKLPSVSLPTFASKDASAFNKLFGEQPMETRSFTLHNHNARESGISYSLTFSALNRSPRYYFIQLVCRAKDMSKAEEFSRKGEQIIKDAVSMLEEG